MVIDTKIMRFMKAAKVICSKNTVNKITGIAYNNQMIVATNCNAQLTYTSDEDRKDTIYLPVKAIDYIMSFGKGSKIDFKVFLLLYVAEFVKSVVGEAILSLLYLQRTLYFQWEE